MRCAEELSARIQPEHGPNGSSFSDRDGWPHFPIGQIEPRCCGKHSDVSGGPPGCSSAPFPETVIAEAQNELGRQLSSQERQ